MSVIVDTSNSDFFDRAHLLKDLCITELMYFHIADIVDTQGDDEIVDLCINEKIFYYHPTQSKLNFYNYCERYCEEVKKLLKLFCWDDDAEILSQLDDIMKAAEAIRGMNEDTASVETINDLVETALGALMESDIPYEGERLV